MSSKDSKSNKNKKKNENGSQPETGKILSFPHKKNFNPEHTPTGDKAPLRLVPTPAPQQPQQEMKGKISKSVAMKSGLIFSFLLGVFVTSQFVKYYGNDGRQIASEKGTDFRDPKNEKLMLENMAKNREPNAVWSLNNVTTDERFLHGYLRGNYQTTYEMSSGLLLSVEYEKGNMKSAAGRGDEPRDFNDLSREEFFKDFARLWVEGYAGGYERIGYPVQNANYVYETYKLKGRDTEVMLSFKLDTKNHLLAIKRAE